MDINIFSNVNITFYFSQGKLPVKWMAIESLETYVFTVESDVWVSRNVIVFCALLFHSGASVSPDQVFKTVDDNTKFSD